MSTIILVDDETGVLNALRRLLMRTPCTYVGQVFPLEIETFSDPTDALEYVRHHTADLIISDYRMPQMDGVAFLKACREIQPDSARIILSGYADLNALIGGINEAQIYRFLSKPWNDYELVSAVATALAYRNLQLENQRLADQVRLQQGVLTAEDVERKRLEELEPGITQVKWGPDGSVLLDED
ncbi:Response regulator receiver domain-containing protein [Formivibrio citricus]|uniref:Response regulator receiver domain-containing protein n=1 Tax=Formivibrio citricus TaxID=83765 RepID=A0A1I4Y6R3_9NEIS|nr:response regulator [Formivibrio citricus]SFN33695.1 Response regulator receiver domain-containing protein [Formivibrio citricus]